MYPHELELLERLWFPVSTVADAHKEPVGARLLGQPLVIYASGGRVAAASDRCPHRGCQLSLGQLQDGELECPYHGWRYSFDGWCTFVPSQPDARPKTQLQMWPCREHLGIVWVALADPLFELPSIPEMDNLAGDWEIGYGGPFDVTCGLRSITENFRDSSHFAFVHRASFGNVSPRIPAYTVRRDGWSLAWDVPISFGDQWAVDVRPERSMYRFGEDDHNSPSDSRVEEVLVHYRFQLPSLSYVYTEHPGEAKRLVCQVVAPLQRDGTGSRVFWFVATNKNFRQDFGATDQQVAIEAQIFAEDVPIVNSLDPLESPLELEAQVHVRADRYSNAYRRLYRDLLDFFAASQVPAEDRQTTTGPREGLPVD